MKYIKSYRIHTLMAVMLALIVTGCQPATQRNILLYVTTSADRSETIATLDVTGEPNTSTILNKGLHSTRIPTWSHSRKDILYATQEGDNIYKLWIANANGTQSHALTDALPFYAGVNGKWSFDDQYVAFRLSSNRYALPTYDLDITKAQNGDNETHTLMSGVSAYAWSPTDNRIAVLKWGSNIESSGLYILEVEGKQQSFFPASSFPRMSPTSINLSWSPDGQHIAITDIPNKVNPATSQPTTVEEVYAIDVKTGNVNQLTDKQSDFANRIISCVAWSPDSNNILFVADYKALNDQLRQGALIVADVHDHSEIQLSDHLNGICPVWSPNGQEIAFVTVDNPQNYYGDIYIANTSMKLVRRVTNNSQPKSDLSW